MHPGGAAVLLDDDIGQCALLLFPSRFHQFVSLAGQDATEAFYGLHRHEVLERPQYQRLQIGYIDGETSSVNGRTIGQVSKVPYAEPTWLAEGYHSPYYKEVRLDRGLHFGVGISTIVLRRAIASYNKPSANFKTKLSTPMPRPVKRMASVPAWK